MKYISLGCLVVFTICQNIVVLRLLLLLNRYSSEFCLHVKYVLTLRTYFFGALAAISYFYILGLRLPCFLSFVGFTVSAVAVLVQSPNPEHNNTQNNLKLDLLIPFYTFSWACRISYLIRDIRKVVPKNKGDLSKSSCFHR